MNTYFWKAVEKGLKDVSKFNWITLINSGFFDRIKSHDADGKPVWERINLFERGSMIIPIEENGLVLSSIRYCEDH
jgi:hypothetical protein